MLKRVRISQKIYAAFGVMIVLMAVMGAAGYLGIQSISGLFMQYRQSTGQLLMTSQIVSNIDALRTAALRYQRDRSDDAIKAFAAGMKAQLVFKAPTAAAFDGNDAAKAALDPLKGAVLDYSQAFSAAKILDQTRQQLLATMTSKSDATTQLLAAVMDFARQTNDPSSMLAAATIGTSAAQMVSAAQRFTMSGVDADYQAIKAAGKMATDQSTELATLTFDPDAAAKLKTTTQAISDYLDSADELKTMTNQRKEIENTQLEAADVKLASRVDALTKTIVDGETALGSDADARTSTTNMILTAVSGIAIVLGVIMAFILGRWLSGTIRRMAKDMEQLAGGDLDLELRAATRRDELGMMGKALEVFRTNGLAIRSNEAQKAQAAEVQEQARQQAMALQAAVEEVVGAAVAGDFSARVPESFVDLDGSGFAHSLNDVMASVERGVGETAAVLEAFAHSDLSRRMEGEFAGAFGLLKDSANLAAENFEQVVRQLQLSSRALKVATREMLAGANELSERTTRQAATIEETSAAMEQWRPRSTPRPGVPGKLRAKRRPHRPSPIRAGR